MEQIIRLNLLKLNDNYPMELKNCLLWGRLQVWVYSPIETRRNLYHIREKFHIWYKWELVPARGRTNLYHTREKICIWYKWKLVPTQSRRNLYHTREKIRIWYIWKLVSARGRTNLNHTSEKHHIWYRFQKFSNFHFKMTNNVIFSWYIGITR